MIGTHKTQLDTPCLLLDKTKLEYNLSAMQSHVGLHQKHYRPHCKTHKSSRIASLQMQYGAIGLSVTLISEAEVLVQNGLKGILITSPLSSLNKLMRFEQLIAQQAHVIPVIDNVLLAQNINAIGAKYGQVIEVLIDVDGGIGRTGIKLDEVLGFAKHLMTLPWLKLSGLQCYAGHLQHISDYQQRRQASMTIMQHAGQCLNELQQQGIGATILSGGGTGTYDIDVEIEQVTEIQPGSYVVMDVEYGAIGSRHDTQFNHFKPALSLLSSVVSANQSSYVTVDAGTKGLYFDHQNYPKVISHPGLLFDWNGFGDEHGKVYSPQKLALPKLGEMVEMIVPHCDPTINLYDYFYLMAEDRVVDIIPIDMRGH